ncbi:MAG: hypothetical protein ACYDCD_02070 [Candidatus Acidiferrales bacterium]
MSLLTSSFPATCKLAVNFCKNEQELQRQQSPTVSTKADNEKRAGGTLALRKTTLLPVKSTEPDGF